MAKISARGDRESRRFRQSDGRVIVTTEAGRVLRKLTASSGYSLMAMSVAAAVAHARSAGYEEVSSCR